jgi:hypothetical protein
MPIIKRQYAKHRHGLEAAGHDMSDVVLPMQRNVYCGESTEFSHAQPEASVMWYQRLNASRTARQTSGPELSTYAFYSRVQSHLSRVEYQDLIDTESVTFDTPDNLIRRIEHLENELGVNYLLCWTDFPGLDPKIGDAFDGTKLRGTLSDRSRDNLPNPIQDDDNDYVPRNMPAIGDLFDLFDFDHHRD